MSSHAKMGHNAPRPTRDELDRMWKTLKDEVKARYPIDRALEDCVPVQWRSRGQIRQACCPFHADKTPSFQANIGTGYYRCWGSGCGANGDVFKLLRDTYGLSFRDAVLEGARRCGASIPDALLDGTRGMPVLQKRVNPDRVAYQPGRVTEVPAGLKPVDLIPVPAGVRLPRAGQFFPVWQDGGRYKDKDYTIKKYRPEMVHDYRGIDGNLLMSVLRCRMQDGRKFFIPVRLAEPKGACPRDMLEKRAPGMAWINEGPGENTRRPIYGMQDAAEWHRKRGRRILMVEGEKCRDTARRMLDQADPYGDWLTLSPMGGASSTVYADWAPLLAGLDRPVTITIWQDADTPLLRHDGSREDRQKLYVGQLATSILQGAIDAGVDTSLITIKYLTPPADVESGWDIADAEAEGWSPAEMMNHVKTNTKNLEVDMTRTRAAAQQDTICENVASGAEDPVELVPFEDAAPAADFDQDWVEDHETGAGEMSDAERMQALAAEFDASLEAVSGSATAVAVIVPPLGADGEAPAAGGEGAGEGPGEGIVIDNNDVDGVANAALRNPFFRCLGYLDNQEYVLSITSGQIFALSSRSYTSQGLLHLAPRDFWRGMYPKAAGRNGNGNNEPTVCWESAFDDIIQGCYSAGVWDPRRQVRQGARIDGGVPVFHTGQKLYVNGQGTMPLEDFVGEHCYTVGPISRTPDFENPFPADSREVREYLHIIKQLAWREETRQLSILSTFGWVVISSICGILRWRPHLWLDGERGSGKTWIVDNLIAPALGDYAERVASNTSESGIRNALNMRSVPIIFDEAEGDDKLNRERMEGVLRLARHSSSGSKSLVTQGVAGGGAHREYAISSTFLLTSIMPQLDQPADKTRFGRARLATGHNYAEFTSKIEAPAAALLDEGFADRLVARMVIRATDYKATYRLMVEVLCHLGLERRVADVYGTFATGAWLALRDGVPASMEDAGAFIVTEFDVVGQLSEFASEMVEERDHKRIIGLLRSHELRFDTRHAGLQNMSVGALMQMACTGVPAEGEDELVSREEALSRLRDLGFRPAVLRWNDKTQKNEHVACEGDELPTFMLVHKNSQPIRNILEKTPYAKTYVDVIHQAEGAALAGVIRFGSGLSTSRTVAVPIRHFGIEGLE